MAEENLLETVPKTPFIEPADNTEIPDMIDPKLFTTPIPVDPESEGTGNKTPEDSDELGKLINEEIAEDIGTSNSTSENGAEDNSKIAEFNAVPEKGARGDDDDDDDDDDDGDDGDGDDDDDDDESDRRR